VFGSYRLLLAAVVAVSHMARPMLDFNIGITAVVQFYLISGFVMAGLIERHYSDLLRRPAGPAAPASGRGRSALHFYADRGLRIYPQYLLFIGLTILLHRHYQFETIFLERPLDARLLLYNLLIIPLDFFMFDMTIQGGTLIPPAWSLGAELQFYLLLPFVLAFGRSLLPLAGASLVVFALAMFELLHPDWYGYRLLPGVLFIFLTGTLLYQARTQRRAAIAVGVLYALVLAIAAGAQAMHGLEADTTAECLSGYLLGVPIVFALSRFTPRRWDDFLGFASYGTFLVHNLVMYVMQAEQIIPGLARRDAFMAVAIAISILLGFAGYFVVERPVIALRRRLRSQWAGARTR